MSFLEELKRRNVVRVGIAYAVTGWLLAQGVDVFLENFGAPEWAIKTVLLIILIGFPLALIFAWAFEMTPEGLKREKDLDPEESIAPVTGRKLDRAIIVVLVLALGWFAWDRFGGMDEEIASPIVAITPEQTTPAPEPAVAQKTGEDDKTIAVLPFTTRSTSEEDSFFSDGMHDDLLTQLAKIGSLKVISRTSVMEYRDTTKNLRQIGQELGAAAILEGAVQRAGNQVRINVQLIDAESDEHLWAETYDRVLSVDNLFAMQTEMARAIASALKATLSPAEEAAIEHQLTENLEALEAYRRAKIMSQYFFADELKRAEAEIRHALELDPEFAMAWAQLAYIQLAQYWGVNPRDEYRVQALEAIERGRSIDPDLTELNIMEGYYHYWGFLDYPAALRVLEPLLPDNRNNAELLQVTAFVNRRAGNWDKTLELLQQAEMLAPRDLGITYTIGETYAILRQWVQAQAYLEKTTALDPAHSRTLQLKAEILAGRDGDFVAGARYMGMAKEHQRFLRMQHWRMLLLAEDKEGALEVAAIMDDEIEPEFEHFRGMAIGLTHTYFGNPDAARPSLEAARDSLEQAIGQNNDDYWLLLGLCETHAALGLESKTLDYCARAREAMAVDAMSVPLDTYDLGTILAMAGDKEAAMSMLKPIAESGIGYSRHWYLANRRLDPLRDHPDWPALMEALEPDQ